MGCRNREKRVRAAAKVFWGSAWRCDLKASQLFQKQHVEVQSPNASQLLSCFVVAFAQDGLLFPGLKGLPIHGTIVRNTYTNCKGPHCGMDDHTPPTDPYITMSSRFDHGTSRFLTPSSSGQLHPLRRLEGAQRMLRHVVEMKWVHFHCFKFARVLLNRV